jgi:hypothetical protein
MVHRGVLLVFQMTISDTKDYEGFLLEEEFISVVRRNVKPAPQRTVVVFVSPKGTGFKCEELTPTLGIKYLTFEVDMASAEEVSRSVRKLFNESINEWSS